MVGRDDTEEGSRGGDQEGFHGEGEVADGGVAFGGGHHTCESADETDYAADGAALEDLSVMSVFFFLAEDLHGDGIWVLVRMIGMYVLSRSKPQEDYMYQMQS